ncbi:palmitoyltransferase ZDHHC15-like isoform X2 [Varroa jacobsoni]|uniref:palmitoyltransferase ZDHHC15-like isoform X2 n=1 Tax=Varroa jacobsoni TaxID=62625 RepID=UPI000BF33B63|nr:palmitoyltransferase ZDHHC15-like isoform X2 [Varroa jacobsoni]
MSCLSRPCMFCVRLFKWLPVVLIITIVAWSYYAYVIQLCAFRVESYVEKVLYLIIFHVSFVMFVWSYWQTIFTDPGEIPRNFYLSSETLDRLEKEPTEQGQQMVLESQIRHLPILCRNYNGSVRYCEKCTLLKPDRTHHCSVCARCLPKMDHHCPWVNNCVAYANYKFFVLFLGYAIIYCLFVAATTCQYFIRFWTGGREAMRDDSTGSMTVEGWGRLHILFLFFVAIMFAISLVSLFCYHCYLVMVNRTTLESFRPPVFGTVPDKRGFYLGRIQNFRQVFGDDKKLWFIPVFTSLGNGIRYPTRETTRTQQRAGDVEAGFGQSQTTASNIPQMGSGPQSPHGGQPLHDYRSMGETPATRPPSHQTSLGDGLSFPQRTDDADTDGLLSARRKWTDTDDTETDNDQVA